MSNTTIIAPGVIRTQIHIAQGVAGPPGAGAANVLTAAQALGGHRVVVATGQSGADYADSSNPLHLGRVVGITTGAAAEGAGVTVQSTGPMEEPSWNWTPDEDLWLSANGLVTQVFPAEAVFAQRIGIALTPTRIWVDISEPVIS